MTDFEMVGLRAKVKVANAYLNNLHKDGIEIKSTDILRVVTRDMRKHVTILEPEVAITNGVDIVRIRSVA